MPFYKSVELKKLPLLYLICVTNQAKGWKEAKRIKNFEYKDYLRFNLDC